MLMVRNVSPTKGKDRDELDVVRQCLVAALSVCMLFDAPKLMRELKRLLDGI
jgi:hypothetical protein